MACVAPDARLAISYWILEGALRFRLGPIQRSAVHLLPSEALPDTPVVARLRLAELKELCARAERFETNLGQVVDLYDSVVPNNDPAQTNYNSPWFFFRNAIIVAASIRSFDDKNAYKTCLERLVNLPTTNDSDEEKARKRRYLKLLLQELSSLEGVDEAQINKKQHPLIYEYLQKDLHADLVRYLESIENSLNFSKCFLEIIADDIRKSEGSSDLSLSLNGKIHGLNLLMEQFQSHLGRRSPKESGRSMPSNKGRSSSTVSVVQSSSKESLEQRPPRLATSSCKGSPSSKEAEIGESALRKRKGADLQEFRSRRRSLLQAAKRIPDPRDPAIATARQIQKALAKGTYELWSDQGDEVSEHEELVVIDEREIREVMPAQSPAQHAVRKMSLDSHLHRVPTPAREGRHHRKGRRSTGKWQDYEVEELKRGIAEYGVGQWKDILENGQFLAGRTGVDLKDKYRNLLKLGPL